MYSILTILALLLLLFEAVFHLKRMNSTYFAQFHATSGESLYHAPLRLLELLFFGLLLSTPQGSPVYPRGQLCLILIALQIVRILGKRILNRSSVLLVVLSVQILLLFTAIAIPANNSDSVFQSSSYSLISFSGCMIYAIFVSVAAAFSVEYEIKMHAHEYSFVYDFFQPLASSEKWALKLSFFSIFPGLIGLGSLFFLVRISALSLLLTGSLLLQILGVYICKKSSYTGHHPAAHVLWLFSFLILYLTVVLGASVPDSLR